MKQAMISTNEHSYEWIVQLNSKTKIQNSNLFELKSSPGLNFCLSAQINTSSSLLKVQIIKTYTKLAIATIELTVAGMPPIIKDVSEWKDVVDFDKIPIPCATDDCQKNTWNVCNLTTPDSHEYRIKIVCSIIWHGFIDELLKPNMFDEMKKYLDKLEYSDIIVRVRDIEFHAHKVVLASQSPIFADKITAADSNDECKEQYITLDDQQDVDVVHEMMKFLYHGELEKTHHDYDIALKLFQLAGNVQLIKLKDVCGVILSNRLAVNNVLILLELARKYDSLILRQRAMTFIINNRKSMFP